MTGDVSGNGDPTRYRIHSGPYDSEDEARANLAGVRGMVDKMDDGWYVLEMYYQDELQAQVNEPDNPRCSVDGCEKPAVVELLQDSTQNRGYRCERCLHYDGEQKGWW